MTVSACPPVRVSACPRVRPSACPRVRVPALAVALLATAAPLAAQSLDSLAFRFAAMTAVTGYEDAMADSVRAALPGAQADRAGNIVWKRGTGEPVRVAVCPMDEVGYVVGAVTAEGYLTLRRVGATAMGPLFDQFLEGQRVTIWSRRGPVPGVVGVRSTHLQRGRAAGTDDPFSLDNAYVDVGATAAAGVAGLGIALLDPVARTKRPQRYGDGLLAAPFVAQRSACAALAAAVRRLPAGGTGTALAVFARRRHFAHDGAGFALLEAARGAPAEQVVFVDGAAALDSLGSGALLGARDSVLVAAVRQAVTVWDLPARYHRTPAETVSLRDVAALTDRLVAFLGGAR
jgi:putative aminopeptidase FrvX